MTERRAEDFRRPFRWRFPCGFRRPFRLRSGARRPIRHGFADRGASILPTSPRPIEVWS